MFKNWTWWDVLRYAVICPFLIGIFYDFEDWFAPTFWIMVIGLIIIGLLERQQKKEKEDKRNEVRSKHKSFCKETEDESEYIVKWREDNRKSRGSLGLMEVLSFTSDLPSWDAFREAASSYQDGKILYAASSFAEFVVMGKRGKLPPCAQHSVCPSSSVVSSEMREEFFTKLDLELRRYGIDSPLVVGYSLGPYTSLDTYIKTHGRGSTNPNMIFTWEDAVWPSER